MRIESKQQQLVHNYKVTGVLNGVVVHDNTTTASVLDRYFERPDIAVNKRDVNGFRRPSKYHGVLLEYKAPSIESSYVRSNLRYEMNGVALSFAYIFGNVHGGAANWENSLKQQALRSVKDQKVNLSMTLAFLPQTLKMIRGNFSTIGSVLLAAQKADWKSVAKLLKINPKSTSSFYLEVLFGWLQLLRDTQGIVEELHRKCNKPHHTFVYGRATRSQPIDPIVKVAKPYHWSRPGIYTFQGDRKIDHRLVMVYRGETALLSRLSTLGLLNPLELMWDLVPWSWVVNMGISIGDFVSTLDATVGLTYLGGTYTSYSRTAGSVIVEPDPDPRYTDWVVNGSPGFYEEMRFNRKVIDDKIDPFVLKNPFGAPLALTAAVIAAAVQRGRRATPQPPRGSTRSILRKRGTRNLPPITYRP